MKHLPSIEALTDADDERLLAELEICHVLDRLAHVRALVDRADRLLTTVLACGGTPNDLEDAGSPDAQLYTAILSSLRKR
jgi:hypothetical protein